MSPSRCEPGLSRGAGSSCRSWCTDSRTKFALEAVQQIKQTHALPGPVALADRRLAEPIGSLGRRTARRARSSMRRSGPEPRRGLLACVCDSGSSRRSRPPRHRRGTVHWPAPAR
jgi:hypothetical protein